jgi:hypothetical protein
VTKNETALNSIDSFGGFNFSIFGAGNEAAGWLSVVLLLYNKLQISLPAIDLTNQQ